MSATTSTASKAASALDLAAHGFRVFPLAAGTKLPLKDFKWKEEASADPDKVRAWWDANPRYNIGVAAGNGLVVVDVDVKDKKPGLASLELLKKLGMPESFRVRTPSGGIHVYLKADRSHSNRANLPDFPGIDVRGQGGYVLGPGSTISGKQYEVMSGYPGNIAPAGELVEAALAAGAATRQNADDRTPLVELDKPENITEAIRYLKDRAPEAIEGAGGDSKTFQVACSVRDYGLSKETALDVMLEHWNEEKASPPWNPDELADKVANAFQYASGGWGAGTAEGQFALAGDVPGDIGKSPYAPEPAEIQRAAGDAPSLHFTFHDYDAMEALPESRWLIPGAVPQLASTVMFGPSNAFKSFLALDMALSVATGRPWHGEPVQKGKVIYLATEGSFGVMKKRIPGWYEHHGIPRADRNNLRVLSTELALDDPKQAKLLLSDLKAIGGIELLILDIFGGTMSGSEIEDTTARTWVHAVQKLIKEAGVTVLTVAHTGWQDKSRSRGHTHFWGSFDTRLQVEGDKAKLTSVLAVERHKDADSRGKWGFRLEPSCGTLVPAMDAMVQSGSQANLHPNLALARDLLETVLTADGESRHGEGWPSCHVVPVEKWHEACGMKLTSSEKAPAGRKAFGRAKQALLERGIVLEHEGHVWLRSAET